MGNNASLFVAIPEHDRVHCQEKSDCFDVKGSCVKVDVH